MLSILRSSITLCPDVSFDRCALAPFGRSVRTDREIAERRGHNERLSIMHNEWIEKSTRAFDDGFVTFDEIQYVNRASSGVDDALTKPVAPRLNVFKLMQAGALFTP